MRNKILRSANTKRHYFYAFFNKINTGDLPLMYSCFLCVCVCEFIDLVGFFGCCVTPVTLFITLCEKLL